MQRGRLERQEPLRCHMIPAAGKATAPVTRGGSRRGLNRAGGMMKNIASSDDYHASMRSLITNLPTQDGKGGASSSSTGESLRNLGMSARLDLYEHQLAMQRSTRIMEDSFCYDDDALTTAALELACEKLSIEPCDPVPEAEERTSLEELVKQAEDQGKQQPNNDINNKKDDDEFDENFEMEIAPGYYVPFRGSKEVWRAVNNGYCLECCCLECATELVCIADCEHVVCPNEACRMVNPVFDRPSNVTTTPFGAGMGLKKEWVTSSTPYASSA